MLFTTQIDTGYLLGLIACGVLVVIVWPLVGWLTRWVVKSDDEDFQGSKIRKHATGVGIFTMAVLQVLTVLGFILVAWPPLPGQYNEYQPFSGTVAATGSRFIASGVQNGGTNQRFLVKFTNGQVVGCDDTRCAGLPKGSQVTLLCERDFQWNAYEGWNCNFGAYGLNRLVR